MKKAAVTNLLRLIYLFRDSSWLKPTPFGIRSDRHKRQSHWSDAHPLQVVRQAAFARFLST